MEAARLIIIAAIRAAATQMLVVYARGDGPTWPLQLLRVAGNSVCYPNVVAERAHSRLCSPFR